MVYVDWVLLSGIASKFVMCLVKLGSDLDSEANCLSKGVLRGIAREEADEAFLTTAQDRTANKAQSILLGSGTSRVRKQ